MSKLFVDEIVHQSSQGSGTITLGASGETVALASGASQTMAVNTPAFKAYLTTGQSTTSGVNTKVTFQTKLYDTNSCYDNTTNYRFTPTSAGKYFFTTKVRFETGSTTNNAQLRIVKNGNSSDATLPNAVYTNFLDNAYAYMFVSGALEANGTTDYFEVFAFQNTGGAVNISASFGASFEAYKLIGA